MLLTRMATAYGIIPAAKQATIILTENPSQLCKIIVTATPAQANPVSIYDSCTGANGNIVFTVPGTAKAGDVYDLNIPIRLGITVAQVSSGPGLCVTWGP